jgi:PKD repeat protein
MMISQHRLAGALPTVIAVYLLWMLLVTGVVAEPSNGSAPIAVAATATTKEDTKKTITLKGTSPRKGSKFTYALVTPPAHGTVVLTKNVATYTPAPNYFNLPSTPDSFTFKVNDGVADSEPARVNVVVTAVNDAPVAQGSSVQAVKNTSQDITLSASDVDSDLLTYMVASTSKKGGKLKLKTGSVVTYTPRSGFIGADSFTFSVKDSQKKSSNTATMNITVKEVIIPTCPLPDPTLSGVVVKGLACQDRVDINYYQKMILPFLINAQEAALGQVNVAAESWSAEAAEKAIDQNPILSTLQGVDSALEGVDAVLQGKTVIASLQFSVSLAKLATAISNAGFSIKGTTGTEQADATGDAAEATSAILETLAKSSACFAAIYDKDAGALDGCFDAVSKTLDSVGALHPDTLMKQTRMDKETFKAQMTALSGLGATASETWKLAKAESLGDAQRALFGVAGGLVKTVRDQTVLAYASKGEQVPTTGVSAFGLGLIDNVATPILTLGNKCWGDGSTDPKKHAIQKAQCASAIVQESGKTGIKFLASLTGTITGLYTVGAHTNQLVAQAVLEEMLTTGLSNLPSLYRKYGLEYRDSGAFFYWSKLALVKAIARSKVANGTFYSPSAALSTVDTYLQQLYGRFALDLNAANITLTADIDPLLGGVIVKVNVAPDTKGFSKGTLACYSNDNNHPISDYLEGDVNGNTNLTFKFNFATGGYKAITCALYRASELFDGAKTVGILLPPNFSVQPSEPKAGSEIRFVAGAKNTMTSYSWDFGDGTTDTSTVFEKKITSHTYLKEGNYTVKLTVMDGWQPVRVEKTITVGEAIDENPKNGIPDWWEAKYGVTDANADDDWDGLTNLEEYNTGTKPKGEGAHDTDGDGFTDGQEVDAGTSPLDKEIWPFIINASAGVGQVTLTWDNMQDAMQYTVCYATESIDDVNKCNAYNGTWVDATTSGVTVSGLQPGKLYYFRAVVFFNGDKRNQASNQVSATPTTNTTTTSCSKPIKSILFKESFDGASIDTTKWDVDQTGGSAILLDGKLSVLANGSNRFPVVQTKANPFPTSGNFSFYCKTQFTRFGSNASGACNAVEKMITNGSSASYDQGNNIGVSGVLGRLPFGMSVNNTSVLWYETGETLDSHEYEVCVVGSSVTGYRDGIKVAEGTLSNNWTYPNKIWLGNPVLGNGDWSTFDTDAVEVRQLEDDTLPPPTAGLVAHWSFDDCTAKDVSGNGHDGVINSSSCNSGIKGSSFKFNGVDSYISVSDAIDLRMSDKKMTTSVFIKPSVKSGDMLILRKGVSCWIPGWGLGMHDFSGASASIDGYAWDGNDLSWSISKENSLVADEWYHMVMTADGSIAKIYINGMLISSADINSNINIDTNSPLFIGAAPEGNCGIPHAFFKGDIDEVRLYNRALSESEIKTLYQQGGNVDNTGWTLNPNTGHYYKALDNCGNWEQCETAAKAVGAHLVVLDDQAENDWVVSTFNVAASTWGYWIGYTDKEQEGTWKTVTGTIATYLNWEVGEPNNSTGWSLSGESYAHIYHVNQWNDISLEQADNLMLKQAIIERTPLTGNANPFTVQAADETGTAFTVPAGKTQCTFNATGTWRGNVGSTTCGADGDLSYNPNAILPSDQGGALIMKRSNKTYELMGKNSFKTLEANEIIHFMMNDVPGTYYDNSGALSVSWSCQ